MSEPKFTKGPWHIDRGHRTNRPGGISAPSGSVVVWRGIAKPASDEGEANAHLIAASPDLYEALEEMVALMDLVYEGKYAPTSMTTDDAHAALRKARGET